MGPSRSTGSTRGTTASLSSRMGRCLFTESCRHTEARMRQTLRGVPHDGRPRRPQVAEQQQRHRHPRCKERSLGGQQLLRCLIRRLQRDCVLVNRSLIPCSRPGVITLPIPTKVPPHVIRSSLRRLRCAGSWRTRVASFRSSKEMSGINMTLSEFIFSVRLLETTDYSSSLSCGSSSRICA